MKTRRHMPALLAAALALATLAFTASCTKTPAPEPFTAQLDDIDGAMFFASLQHPKLIVQGLNKLTAEIPEASFLTMLLAARAGQFGYPEFTDIAPGANIGLYLPVQPLDELKHGTTPPILIIKLKENGKIWNLLVKQAGMSAKKIGDWTMFAQNDADFASVKNPAALTARLAAPQTENIRLWARLNGETAAAYETALNDTIAKTLAQSKLPAPEKTAFTAYARALLGELLTSTHSAHATLNLGDTGLRLSYGAQFKPDSPAGTALRYRSHATPTVAQYITNDTLYSGVVRMTPKAIEDYSNHLTDLILKVDYPPISEPLAKLKQDTAFMNKQMDGTYAATANLDMNLDFKNPRASKNHPDYFYVYSGKFDERSLPPLRNAFDIAKKFADQILAFAREKTGPDMPALAITNEPNALTIDGAKFDAFTLDVTNAKLDMPSLTVRYYYGIAGGNMILATKEETLKTRLPALLARKKLPNNVADANPLQPYEMMNFSINGAPLTDLVTKITKLDLTDTDNQSAIADIKDAYKQTTPVRTILTARQADATITIDIPYKFVAASVRLGRYVYSIKN